MWFKKKSDNNAIKDYDEAIRLDPGNAWAFYYRGHLWFSRADYTKAIADYDNAIKLGAVSSHPAMS
jgi:tetratricopeptide (TPR) repeat protein